MAIWGYTCDNPQDWKRFSEELASCEEAGDSAACIALCYQFIARLDQEKSPEMWCRAHFELAWATFRLHRSGGPTECIEDAISLFESLRNHWWLKKQPELLGVTLVGLGNAYKDKISDNSDDNLEKALHYYLEAQTMLPREIAPEKWAKVQLLIADLYKKRVGGIKAQNLELALQYAMNAQEVFTWDSFRSEWGLLELLFGRIYQERIRGDKAENQNLAISHYRRAQREFPRKWAPKDWAIIQDNLGLCFTHRISGNRARNLEQAIRHWFKALEVFTNKRFPNDRRRVRRRLLNAQRQLAGS